MALWRGIPLPSSITCSDAYRCFFELVRDGLDQLSGVASAGRWLRLGGDDGDRRRGDAEIGIVTALVSPLAGVPTWEGLKRGVPLYSLFLPWHAVLGAVGASIGRRR